MQQIINFVIRNKTFLLFLLLFGISFALTIQSHSFHRSKFINSANFLTGGIYKNANSIGQYFNLKEENKILIEENLKLKSLIYNVNETPSELIIDSSTYNQHFNFKSAIVYKNSYASANNYITINKGLKDGIKQDYGVITSKGIVGIIDHTSNNYATVLSVLNTKSRINAQLKKSNHIGSLKWNGNSTKLVQLTDVSKFAPVNIADTIVTGGQSTIFPKGIPIGIVEDFAIDISGDTYTIDIELFNDMTNLGHVYIIENTNAEEIKSLQNLVDE
ncbi:rod shape-determining protein MreC [Flavobacteriales bacterium 34_180_T64]|nr:rod shape-determining protein MreC [Flavobacteriales bacterium 34_180_T64]